jgi:hypothetical protein
MMDDMKGKMGNMDDMRARFNELKGQEKAGNISDKGREELARLRDQFKK